MTQFEVGKKYWYQSYFSCMNFRDEANEEFSTPIAEPVMLQDPTNDTVIKVVKGIVEPVVGGIYTCTECDPLTFKGEWSYAYHDDYRDVTARYASVLDSFGIPVNLAVADLVREICMPWPRETVFSFSDDDIEASLQRALIEHTQQYNGSTNGYASHEEETNTLLTIIFGPEKRNLIKACIDDYRNVKVILSEGSGKKFIQVLIDDTEIDDFITLIEKPYMLNTFNLSKGASDITPEKLEWCREHAPAAIQKLSDKEVWEFMKDSYEKYHFQQGS